MAFEGLSEKLNNVFKKLTGRGRLTEADIKEAMREVRIALLEADVNFKVVKDLIKSITEKAMGQDILASLTPGQQVIKIVNDELVALMGGAAGKINISSAPPTVIMLCGLQGAGKTTAAGKLAHHFIKQGRRPLLAACDIYRPAAIDQLRVVAERAGAPLFERGTQDPVKTAKEAVAHAKGMLNDIVIVDTAGRLHIDEELMDELKRMKAELNPGNILLTVDAMTGQDAVNVAAAFDGELDITGVILAKLDGDTRGGAALSLRAVTGKPILFSSVGEKIDSLEQFHPDRMASRILGMGDVLTLIEKAQESFDDKKAEELERKMRRDGLTLEDFLEQMQQMKSMGSMQDILSMIPGMGNLGDAQIDEKALARSEAIIRSMTPRERRLPEILNASRRRRIAAGSGTTVQQVNQLLRQFEQARKMMKQFAGGSKRGKRGFKIPFIGG